MKTKIYKKKPKINSKIKFINFFFKQQQKNNKTLKYLYD